MQRHGVGGLNRLFTRNFLDFFGHIYIGLYLSLFTLKLAEYFTLRMSQKGNRGSISAIDMHCRAEA